jgi:deoxyribonuclease IV
MTLLSVGFHVSIAGSVDLAVDRAQELGCSTFQIFTRNPRVWKYKQLGDGEVSLFREKRKRMGFGEIVDHMPYLPNLATSDREVMKRSRAALVEEVRRCGILGVDHLVVHLGSHMGGGSMVGIRNVAAACQEAIDKNRNEVRILLEVSSGQKNSVGGRFEDIRLIMDSIRGGENRVGVCLDTCHVFAAGFDIRSKEAVARTMELFDEIVGLEQVRVVHLNDSKGALGSNLDRHEHIGLGKIGIMGFRAVLGYPGIDKKLIVMETPLDEVRDCAGNLRVVRRLIRA